jgi:hypothetical protein
MKIFLLCSGVVSQFWLPVGRVVINCNYGGLTADSPAVINTGGPVSWKQFLVDRVF